jgi:excisionase family DNA binding protein
MTDRLVLSVAEAAEALGVSDDLVYELTERGELPCLRLGNGSSSPAWRSSWSWSPRSPASTPLPW